MKKRHLFLLGALFLLGSLLISYSFITYTHQDIKQDPTVKKVYRIALSKYSDSEWYSSYKEALLDQDSTLEIYDMYYTSLDSALQRLDSCDGLLLTGGADIFPGIYGKIKDTARCGEFDRKRDTLELRLFRKAREKKIPILGICRGLQMINVALGGSLLIDIPSDWADTTIAHRKRLEFKDMHYVIAKDSSRFKRLVKADSAYVNSYHHQGIDHLAQPLEIVAYAPDGLPEAIELKENDGTYLFAVQYHPERLEENNPYAAPLFESFIEAVKSKKEKP